MLQHIRIKNFQSLHDVDLELGKFTVIVGASSSGKSALIRALKAVSSNALNSDYITQGTKKSAITVKTDTGTVTIERDSNGSSSYKVSKTGGKESSYTKLNRQVPTEVTEVLGVTPYTQEVGSINFASQFDSPYLLKDSSGNVARILGELTNVHTIFAAVREANKKVKNSSTVLNLRKKDLDKVINQISDYAEVGTQAKLITEAEEKLAVAQQLNTQVTRLATLTMRLQSAQNSLYTIKQIPEVPDMAPAIKAQENLDRFVNLIRQLQAAGKNIETSTTSDLEAQSAILAAEEDLHQALEAMGQCPLCKQEIV